MKQRCITIAGREIGAGFSPYIIAEISGNHGGSLEEAKRLIRSAVEHGADAIKLQTYRPDTITLDKRDGEFLIQSSESLWNGRYLYELYQEAHTPWEWHPELFLLCRDLGVPVFSSPFDATAVDLLEDLDAPAYKIASPENIDHELIRLVAETGKPVIISNGMSTVVEIAEAVEVARDAGCEQLALLHCTTAYPAKPSEANLATIPHMAELFDVPVGLSDHHIGNGVAMGAVALGACLIEKHITSRRDNGFVDSLFSLEPAEFGSLKKETHAVWQGIGKVRYGPSETEKQSLKGRRSLYVVKDMEQGEIFTAHNVRSIRPGLGLAPKHLPVILGRTAACDISFGTALEWSHLS